MSALRTLGTFEPAVDDLPMTCWCDEVEQDVNAIVSESGVTLDS